jgi:glycosyltransferase involved in cell wall biosynthesis
MIDEMPPDGAERLIVDVLQNRSPQYRYSVACLIRGGELVREVEAMGVPVYVLGLRPGVDLLAIPKLIRWLAHEHVDVLHTHLYSADSYGRVAAWLARVPGRFSTRHNTQPWPGGFRPWLARLLGYVSTRVIACSEEVGKVLVEGEGVPAAKIVVIPNGINLQRFEGADRTAFRKELGIPADVPLIGVIGRLYAQKAHTDLLEALSTVRARGLPFHCAIVGSGELRDSIVAEIARRNLQSHVTMTGQRSDIPNILAGIDIFAMSSHWEGLPMALLEGMAMGNAVVATTVGGIPSVVTPEHDGLLVPPSTPAAFADALSRVIGDSSLRHKLGSNAKRTVESRFSAASVARSYEALYSSALHRAS